MQGVLFVIDTSESSESPDANLIEQKFESMWKDGTDREMSPCPISVVTINKDDEVSVINAQKALASFGNSSKCSGAGDLPAKVADIWDGIGVGIVAPVLSSGRNAGCIQHRAGLRYGSEGV